MEVSVYDVLMCFFVQLSRIALFSSWRMRCSEEPEEETYAIQMNQLMLEIFLNGFILLVYSCKLNNSLVWICVRHSLLFILLSIHAKSHLWSF